jgi:hypothetical protein
MASASSTADPYGMTSKNNNSNGKNNGKNNNNSKCENSSNRRGSP